MPFPILFALNAEVAVYEFDHRPGGIIAVAKTSFQNTCVAARTVLVTWAQRIEELLDHVVVAQSARGQASGVQVAALGKRDVLVHHALEVLGLGQRCHDLFVTDERGSHVREHGLAMPAIATKSSP